MRGAKEESLPGRPDTSFFFLSLVLLLGLIDSVGDCLFKFLGPEVVGKPWPTMPVGSLPCGDFPEITLHLYHIKGLRLSLIHI